ncbi:MAG: hypothetical protein KIS92_15710 [Planctomycetota bacterium]|nr:hypothetical protein [Planctomycetota bacterium]
MSESESEHPCADALIITPSFDLPLVGYFHGGKRLFTAGGAPKPVFTTVGHLSKEFCDVLKSKEAKKEYMEACIRNYERLYLVSSVVSIGGMIALSLGLIYGARYPEVAITLLMMGGTGLGLYMLMIRDAYRLLARAVRDFNAT